MLKFKKGDIVRCIGEDLLKGKTPGSGWIKSLVFQVKSVSTGSRVICWGGKNGNGVYDDFLELAKSKKVVKKETYIGGQEIREGDIASCSSCGEQTVKINSAGKFCLDHVTRCTYYYCWTLVRRKGDIRGCAKEETPEYLTLTNQTMPNFPFWGQSFPQVEDKRYFNRKTIKKQTTMQKLTSKLKRLFNKDLRKLYRAGFIDDCNNLTMTGQEELDFLVRDTHQEALVKVAEERIKEAEKKK